MPIGLYLLISYEYSCPHCGIASCPCRMYKRGTTKVSNQAQLEVIHPGGGGRSLLVATAKKAGDRQYKRQQPREQQVCDAGCTPVTTSLERLLSHAVS